MTKVDVVSVESEEKQSVGKTIGTEGAKSMIRSLRPLEVTLWVGGLLFTRGQGYHSLLLQSYSTFSFWPYPQFPSSNFSI